MYEYLYLYYLYKYRMYNLLFINEPIFFFRGLSPIRAWVSLCELYEYVLTPVPEISSPSPEAAVEKEVLISNTSANSGAANGSDWFNVGVNRTRDQQQPQLSNSQWSFPQQHNSDWSDDELEEEDEDEQHSARCLLAGSARGRSNADWSRVPSPANVTARRDPSTLSATTRAALNGRNQSWQPSLLAEAPRTAPRVVGGAGASGVFRTPQQPASFFRNRAQGEAIARQNRTIAAPRDSELDESEAEELQFSAATHARQRIDPRSLNRSTPGVGKHSRSTFQ